MEQNFQTSFIPKKPMVEQTVAAKRPISLLLVISIIILISVALVSGGAYFYKNILLQNVSKMENDLKLAQNRFELSKINQLKLLDKRLEYANQILTNHITVSPIFQTLQDVTLKTIRYNIFGFDFANGKIIISISGQAVGYRSVALQADAFTKNKNIIDPVFSNLSLDDKGNVLFDLQFSVDKSFVGYEQLLKTTNNSSSSLSTGIVN